MEDRKQIADYFVVAGLTQNSMPLEDFSFDGSQLKSTYDQAPITDITVIIRTLGEAVPQGFICVEHTPSGLPADLNYGSLRSPEVYLCYRRDRDRPPLVDIGVLFQGKERVMSDSEIVLSTPYGRPANVNNSLNQHTYLTYRRAPDSAPCNDLVVSDICVVITSKGEQPPHAYCMIKKNLNKGMLGSDVYLCYKKSMNKPRYIAYRPGIQARYPQEDIPHFPLPDSVPLFCLPMGATLEWWPAQAGTPKPVFSTFVLTVSDAAEKVYGSAVTFYERYPESRMSKEQRAWLDMEDVSCDQDSCVPKDYTINTIKSICILSHWPFFDAFEKFLRFLHRMAHSGPHPVPLERYISHFLYDVPFPSPQRPRILIQLSTNDRIALAQPEDLPLPRRGASFRQLLLNLGPDGCLLLLTLALTEQKVLLHSLRPDVLTATAEALVACIFPFKWQCPYIPLCPLGLSDVLNAPVPFLIGVDSRFFDMYDPPADVSCVDLDTNTISLCEEKKNFLSAKMLPKKPTRTLRNTLQSLFEKIYVTHWSEKSRKDATDTEAALDKDFKIKKKELLLELEIQEAFLKFMASIVRGYRSYLLPITKAPTIGATDPNSLFDLTGFLRSRDKTYVKFYSLLMKTQMFIRFIEERSFVSDMDSSLAFFDECSDKTDLDDTDVKLLELDESHQSERTVFVMPPESTGLPPNITYTYEQFGDLNLELMARPSFCGLSESPRPLGSSVKPRSNSATANGLVGPSPGSPLARRTKHEIKNSQKFAKKYAETPMLWARCLLNTCFSIWFLHLPSHLIASPSKVAYATLVGAHEVLVKMQKLRLHPADEVCYRVMMQLCGAHSQPVLAVKVLFEMKRHGVQPNAITYGFYNKAVLEAHWSSDMANHSQLLWHKLRNVVTAAALFRQAGRVAMRRRRSQHSSTSVDDVDMGHSGSASDADGLSRISADSSHEAQPSSSSSSAIGTCATATIYRNTTVSGGSQSDVGYMSMVEGKKRSSSHTNLVTGSKEDAEISGDVKLHRRSVSASSSTTTKRPAKILAAEPHTTVSTTTGVVAAGPAVTSSLDFSESDEFRSRVGSIVKSSSATMSNGGCNAPVLVNQNDSAAGLLMNSLGSKAALSPSQATQLKAALNLSEPTTLEQQQQLQQQQSKGATLPRERANPPTVDYSSQAKSALHSASAASLFRSASLKLGSALISPLTEASSLNPTVTATAKSAITSRLQWVRSSIRRKLDMTSTSLVAQSRSLNPPSTSTLPTNVTDDAIPSVPVTDCPGNSDPADTLGTIISAENISESSTRTHCGATASPLRIVVTQGDPLGALGGVSTTVTSSITTSTTPGAAVSVGKAFKMPDSGVRLFADVSSSSSDEEETTESESSDSDGSTDSETSGDEQDGQEDDDDDDDDDDDNDDDDEGENGHSRMASKFSMSRYSGARWSLRKPEFRVNLGGQVLENALHSLSPQNLNARKAELLVGLSKLHNAASSVAKKFDIKGVISGSGGAGVVGGSGVGVGSNNSSTSNPSNSTTPSKFGSAGLAGSEADRNAGAMSTLTVEDAADSWSTWTAQWLRRASSAELTSQNLATAANSAAQTPNATDWSSIDGQGPSVLKGAPSLTSLSGHLERLCPWRRIATIQGRDAIAMEIVMTSSSKCHNCLSILYDEEIMAGWTPEDSNLNTRCQHCKKLMVPFLSIQLRDFRRHALGSVEKEAAYNDISSGVSQESVGSAQISSMASTKKSAQVPETSNEKSNTKESVWVGDVDDSELAPVLNEFPIANSTQETSVEANSDEQEVLQVVAVTEENLQIGGISDSEEGSVFNSEGNSLRVGSSTAPTKQRADVEHVREAEVGGEENVNIRGAVDSKEAPVLKAQEKLLDADAIKSAATFGPITVPYLSPLVLRRELENILELEGDVCLTQSSFVDQHPILYWNMVWFFERVGLVSHLAGLALRASVGLNAAGHEGVTNPLHNDHPAAIHPSWVSADERNVFVKTRWDNPSLHDEIGPPLYTVWQQTGESHSPLVSALVTDHQTIPRSLLQQIVSRIQYNDLVCPLKLLMAELIKRKSKSGAALRHHGIYRELLFLSFAAIGRDNIDQVAFDREYRLAYDRLDGQFNAVLAKVDAPPTISSVFCRHFFRQLQL